MGKRLYRPLLDSRRLLLPWQRLLDCRRHLFLLLLRWWRLHRVFLRRQLLLRLRVTVALFFDF